MNQENSFSKLVAAMLVVFIFTSCQTSGQENKNFTVYESSEQMLAAAKEVITEITVEDFQNTYTQDDIFIIDVRTAAEYNAGAIPGAVNIPRGVLEFKIELPETWEGSGKNPPQKDDPIFVYCSSGGRGALSAKSLMQLGYKNVQSLQGGWGAWNVASPNIKE
jgi:rhodanese-related sulfurtransferase